MSEDDRARLASRVRQRRLELGLTQRDAATSAGVADQTWLNIERGMKVSERTIVGIDRALRWQAGSAAAVLTGGEPEEIAGATRSVEERLAVIEAELAALKRIVYARHPPTADEVDEEDALERLGRAASRRPGRRPAGAGEPRAG